MLSPDEIRFVKANIAQKRQLTLREVEMCILLSRLKSDKDWINPVSATDIADKLCDIKNDVQRVYRELGKNEYGGDAV